MFDAYPRQRRQWPLKLFLLLLAVGMVGLVMYASTVTGKQINSTDMREIQFLQPILASPSFEVGIWTRQKAATSSSRPLAAGHNGATGDPQSVEDFVADSKQSLRSTTTVGDTAAAVAMANQREVERLRKELDTLAGELKLERARYTRQVAEFEALRRHATDPASAPASTTTTTEDPVAESIPESLWRQPPSSDAGVGTPAATAPTTTSTTRGVPQQQQQTLDQGDSRITVSSNWGSGIVVQIGRPRPEEPTPAPPPSQERPTEKLAVPPAPQEPVNLQTSPAELTPVATTVVPPSPTVAPAPAAQKQPDVSEGQITVKTNGVVVQIGGSSPGTSDSSAEAAEPAAPAPALARAPAQGDVPTTQPPPPMRATTTTAVSSAAAATTSVRPPEATTTTTTILAVGKGSGTHAEPADAKAEGVEQQSQGTQITVKAKGQSITIQIGSTADGGDGGGGAPEGKATEAPASPPAQAAVLPPTAVPAPLASTTAPPPSQGSGAPGVATAPAPPPPIITPPAAQAPADAEIPTNGTAPWAEKRTPQPASNKADAALEPRATPEAPSVQAQAQSGSDGDDKDWSHNQYANLAIKR